MTVLTRPARAGFPRYTAGRYYALVEEGGDPISTQHANEQVIYAPFISVGLRIDRLGANVAVAGNAGSLFRLGLYANAGTGHDAPGALILDAGTIDAASIGDKELTVAATGIPAGVVWACIVAQAAPTTVPRYIGISLVSRFVTRSAIGTPAAMASFLTGAGAVVGALPASASAPTGTDTRSPVLMARAAP